jgi:hypothetical protein
MLGRKGSMRISYNIPLQRSSVSANGARKKRVKYTNYFNPMKLFIPTFSKLHKEFEEAKGGAELLFPPFEEVRAYFCAVHLELMVVRWKNRLSNTEQRI